MCYLFYSNVYLLGEAGLVGEPGRQGLQGFPGIKGIVHVLIMEKSSSFIFIRS